MKGIRILAIAAATAAVISCCRQEGDFSRDEIAVIHGSDSIMRVLTTHREADMTILRSKSTDLSYKAIASDDFSRLSDLMISTVTHPSQDGVGIAAPQVGLNRRVVTVQRFDKEGEPFETYPNIRIIWASDSLALGSEGCLSVPDRSGKVLRSKSVVIEYADLKKIKRTGEESDRKDIPTVRDTVHGFTAVIFQHETDHLDGILYIDRLQ